MFTKQWKSALGQAFLAAAVLGGALFFAGAPNAKADERGRYAEQSRTQRYDYHRFQEPTVYRHDYRFQEPIIHRGTYRAENNYWRSDRQSEFRHGWRDRRDRD